MNNPSVIAVLDKAFWFMAAFWATVGCPNRRELANAFANMTDEQRREGLKIRRSNVKKIAQHVNDEHAANREVTFTDTGDVPEEFLEAEETLPFRLLLILRKVCLSCFGLETPSAWIAYEGQTFTKDGNPLGQTGEVRFIRIETNFMMPLPRKICANFYAEVSEGSSAQSRNEPEILHIMESIAGHYLGAGYVGDPHFSNPGFTEGMGNGAARQIIYLFSDGSCTFIVNGGRGWCHEGICMEPSSEFRIHTAWIPRHIDVTRRITSCRHAILVHLASCSLFRKRSTKQEAVPNGGWILSECLSLPENLNERDVGSLSNDSSFWWVRVTRGGMPKCWLLDPVGTIRRRDQL